jgi:hypothetical protein
MICPTCAELTGDINSEMVHKKDVEAVRDPESDDGFSERKICWWECEKQGHQVECDGRCRHPLDEL